MVDPDSRRVDVSLFMSQVCPDLNYYIVGCFLWKKNVYKNLDVYGAKKLHHIPFCSSRNTRKTFFFIIIFLCYRQFPESACSVNIIRRMVLTPKIRWGASNNYNEKMIPCPEKRVCWNLVDYRVVLPWARPFLKLLTGHFLNKCVTSFPMIIYCYYIIISEQFSPKKCWNPV